MLIPGLTSLCINILLSLIMFRVSEGNILCVGSYVKEWMTKVYKFWKGRYLVMRIGGYETMNASFSGTQMLQGIGQRNTGKPGISGTPGISGDPGISGKPGICCVPGDRDTVEISLFGQNNSRIKYLMEQRQSLVERKNEWLQSAMEKGEDVKSLRDMLDSYEEQMKELDQQISQEMARQNREQLDKAQQAAKKEEEPKTKEEIEQERMASLMALSSGISQAETVQSSQTRIDGEARVLESEIKMDKGRTGDTEITAKKEEQLAKLQAKAAELTSAAGEISGDVIERIDKVNKEGTPGRQEMPEDEAEQELDKRE